MFACSRTGVLGILLLILYSPASQGGSCSVPTTHSTIQNAIDDLACTDIQLAPQSFNENLNINRSLSLSGPPTGVAILRGQAVVTGLTTNVAITNMRVENGCSNNGIMVSMGAQVSASGTRFRVSSQLPCIPGLLLLDGFES